MVKEQTEENKPLVIELTEAEAQLFESVGRTRNLISDEIDRLIERKEEVRRQPWIKLEKKYPIVREGNFTWSPSKRRQITKDEK